MSTTSQFAELFGHRNPVLALAPMQDVTDLPFMGLITRYGGADLPPDGTPPAPTWAGARHVERLIMVGTPNAGSLEALGLLRQVSGAFLDRADTCFLEALLALDVGQLELAEERFQRCLALPEAQGRGGSSSEMARTWGPAYHLGVLRECLDLPQDAREYYELALTFHPAHAESRAALARLAAIDSSGESITTS